LHGLCPSSGKENAFAESTLDLDNNGRKWFCELVKVSQRLPERLRFGGLFLCLNDSWLIDRVRGSLFRAARGRREDFVEADDSFGKALPGIVLCRQTSKSAYLESATKCVCLSERKKPRATLAAASGAHRYRDVEIVAGNLHRGAVKGVIPPLPSPPAQIARPFWKSTFEAALLSS